MRLSDVNQKTTNCGEIHTNRREITHLMDGGELWGQLQREFDRPDKKRSPSDKAHNIHRRVERMMDNKEVKDD